MSLTPEVLAIDPAAISRTIVAFIHDRLIAMKRRGIVVPISGGLDSSVVATLCVRAEGKERVRGLMLPEKEGNPEAGTYSRMIADHLGIVTSEMDVSSVLQALGAYDFALSRIPTRFVRGRVVAAVLGMSADNPFMRTMRGEGGSLAAQGMASFYLKNRVRFVVACKFAEENGLMLAGSAHLSEDMVGLFVKYGVDDLADVMPIKNLYRTQILQLAGYLELPRTIMERTPNPDIIPGVTDKYRDVLGLDSGTLDLVLYGLAHKMGVDEIARELGVGRKKVEEIKCLVDATRHMRDHSQGPPI